MVHRSLFDISTVRRFLVVLSISVVGFLVFAIVLRYVPSPNVAPSDGSGVLLSLPPYNNTTVTVPTSKNSVPDSNAAQNSSSLPVNGSKIGSQGASDGSKKLKSGRCDLYRGKWVYNPSGPLYTNNSCPIISRQQNCQGNGRPDKEYENWRWKPDKCELPRFDARRFLEMMRGKTLAFVGDSVARNQMESLVCILWQVEVPKNRGRRRTQRWFFRSTSTWVVRIWSSWLVHRSNDAVEYAPEEVDKIHLDTPDETFMEYLTSFDVLVLSSGHWMTKRSVYVRDNRIVGAQGWRPEKTRKMKLNSVAAYGITTETALSAIATHPNYTGLTILRTYSPDHYEGGQWNTGGSCTGKTKPLAMVVRNGYTDAMHGVQLGAFRRAAAKVRTGGPRLWLMDITETFAYRHDGHPGPFRSTDPNKRTTRDSNGRPPPQDCLHWCMPGPIDTWNEILAETIRRVWIAVSLMNILLIMVHPPKAKI